MTQDAHPSRERLMAWVDGRVEGEAAAEISGHVDSCEFCREFCDDHREYMETYRGVCDEIPPVELDAAKDYLQARFWRGKTIDLTQLKKDSSRRPSALAADGEDDDIVVHRVATMYSEDPEIVLLVVPGRERGCGHLQLLADDRNLTAGVLVRIDELDREFVTDGEGLAKIEGEEIPNPAAQKWQVKLPNAVFQLHPLVFDPERTEATHETTLETDQGDRIQLTVEKKTIGRRIGVRVLELDGRADFGAARVVVSREFANSIDTVRPDETLRFELDDADSEVSIRLFL